MRLPIVAAGTMPHLRLGLFHGRAERPAGAGAVGSTAGSDENTLFLFDPPTAQIEVDEEEDPSGEEEEAEQPAAGDAGDAEDDEDEDQEPDAYAGPQDATAGQ